jgi:hypothetical protein
LSIALLQNLNSGNFESEIFHGLKVKVEHLLAGMNPGALEKITQTHNDIEIASSPLRYQQVAYACRDILQDFADSIYNQDYLPPGEPAPSREQTIRKIRFTFMALTGREKTTERKLAESHAEYLESYLKQVNDEIQKTMHPVISNVTKEDAESCVIHIYLLISDVVRLIPAGSIH